MSTAEDGVSYYPSPLVSHSGVQVRFHFRETENMKITIFF
jgi:hypothetical protein